MMNMISIALVFVSLITAQVLHPSSSNPQTSDQDVIFKEGHRVVVVETFDHEGHHNTKVSISPELKQETSDTRKESSDNIKESPGRVGDVAERLKGRIFNAPHVKDLEEGASKKTEELVEEMKKKAHDAKESMKRLSHETQDGLGLVHDAVSDKTEELKQKAKTKAHDAKETMNRFTHETRDGLGHVNDAASEIIHKGKESADELKEKAKNTYNNAMPTKTMIEAKMYDLGERVRRAASYFTANAFPLSMGTINLFGSSISYGVSIWVTFVSSHVLAGALPRQQFAVVQSKIYPVYFKTLAYSIGAALIGQYLGNQSDVLSCFNLLVAMAFTLFNGAILEPRATKVMFGRMKLEKESARGVDDVSEEVTRRQEKDKGGNNLQRLGGDGELQRASERLKKLNMYSSLLNVMTLMAITMHLGHLTRRIRVAS